MLGGCSTVDLHSTSNKRRRLSRRASYESPDSAGALAKAPKTLVNAGPLGCLISKRKRVNRLAWLRDHCHYGDMQTVFEAAGGMGGLRRLAGAWHRRVMSDEVVGHAFSHGFHIQHVERLAAYWAEALGGPSSYSDCYGDETAVVKMHSGNGKHKEMDDRAIACFDQALVDVGLADGPLRQVLHDYFAWATTTAMARYPRSADEVPNVLSIPQWSWDGLQV